MERITIGFSSHKKWNLFSAIIKAVDKTPYSHVYISFKSDSLERELVYHAARSFLHFFSMDNFIKKNEIFFRFEIEIDGNQKKEMLQKCIDKAGLNYGLLAVFGVGLVKLGAKKNPFADKGRTYFCSELVADILKTLDIDNGVDPENDSVKWLYSLLIEESQKPNPRVFIYPVQST